MSWGLQVATDEAISGVLGLLEGRIGTVLIGATQGKLRHDLIELDSDRKNAFIAAGRSTEMPLILFWFWFQLPFQFP
jgi:hypothetical protein